MNILNENSPILLNVNNLHLNKNTKHNNETNENIAHNWIDMGTYWLSTAEQCGETWAKIRRGIITSGICSQCANRSIYKKEPEELARISCGIDEQSFDPKKLDTTNVSITSEPLLRKWFFEKYGIEIKTVGFGIWKKDPRFGGSPDGIIDEDICVEMKLPKRMYPNLTKRFKYGKKSEKDHSHIFDSQYDQMQQNMVIFNKKKCYYLVYAYEEEMFYFECIERDYDHWYNELYLKGVEFHEKYIAPLLKENNIIISNPK